MRKDERILHQLRCIAEDMNNDRLPRIAAAIVYKKEIVGYGVCCRRSDPLQKRFGRTSDAIFLHAEIAAIKNSIKRIGNIEFLKSSTLYIARRKNMCGEFVDGLSKPCAGCQRAIDNFKIKRVVYTSNDGEI